MIETVLFSLVFCAVISGIAYKVQSLPAMFISSLGLVITALRLWQIYEEVLPMLMLFFIAFVQPMLVRSYART